MGAASSFSVPIGWCATTYCPSSFLFFLLCHLVTGTRGQVVPSMYVLGDSMLDVGNNNYLPDGYKANLPPYGVDFPGGLATGRCSNGKIPADFLAEKLGVQSPPPYLSLASSDSCTAAVGAFLKGVSFASGGAAVSNTTNKGHCLTLDDQIELLSEVRGALVSLLGVNKTQNHLARSLFMVGIGNNDVLSYYTLQQRRGSIEATPKQFLNSLFLKLRGQLRKMYDLGARRIVFVGPVADGCCPKERLRNKKKCVLDVNRGASKFNKGASATLKSLKSELGGMSYSFVDGYSSFIHYIHGSSAHGFTDVQSACCGGGKLNAETACLPNSTYCSDRRSRLFWDAHHPTEAFYVAFTDAIFDGAPPHVFPVNVRNLVGL